MISIKSLTVSYSNEEKVINNLSLELEGGCIHGIVGLNGAGKTTLLKAIFGLLKLDTGSVFLNGKPLTKKETGYLPAENFFYSSITGSEYLSLFKNKSFETEKWNELFGLPLDELIDNYSTGMKKKLALLGVLKPDKQVMILDEPFNGLDIETGRILRSVLLQLKKTGKLIIVTSHILETLTNLCDYIHHLEKGIIDITIKKPDFGTYEKELYAKIENRSEIIIRELLKK
jgi:ABC-2 type transport system ATP-binding protein